MGTILSLLVTAHIIGAVLGVGGATMAEVLMIRSLRDGVVTPEEQDLMRATYTFLRIGLYITVLSGFGFLLYFRLMGMEQILYSQTLWAKLTIIGILSANAFLMQLRALPPRVGAAISFTSWYAALIIGSMGKNLHATYFEVLAIYAVVLVLVYFVMKIIYRRFAPRALRA